MSVLVVDGGLLKENQLELSKRLVRLVAKNEPFSLVSVGFLSKWPIVFKIPLFTIKVFFHSTGKNKIISLDGALGGFSAVFVSFFLSKPSVVYVDRDDLWEGWISHKDFAMPFFDFYRLLPALSIKNLINLKMKQFTTSCSDSLLFKDKEMALIWAGFYNFDRGKVLLIKNKTAGN